MDCNLGCYYCYQERSTAKLASADVQAIVALARKKLLSAPLKSLHVEWYGGEPLLNVAFLEEASLALQALCEELGARYVASIVTNGTLWPEDVGNFVATHNIRQAQVSLDGFGAHHDERRHYRRGNGPPQGSETSSFRVVVASIDTLLDHCQVDIRFNVDKRNVADFVPLLQFARKRGWFDRRFPAVIQPARLSRYSDRTNFMLAEELDVGQFEAARAALREAAGADARIMTTESPHAFPLPRSSVCGALAANSVVIGSGGELYRCGLQAGEKMRAVGNLSDAATFVECVPREMAVQRLPGLPGARANHDDLEFWREFDPTTRLRCSACSFLPIC